MIERIGSMFRSDGTNRKVYRSSVLEVPQLRKPFGFICGVYVKSMKEGEGFMGRRGWWVGGVHG